MEIYPENRYMEFRNFRNSINTRRIWNAKMKINIYTGELKADMESEKWKRKRTCEKEWR